MYPRRNLQNTVLYSTAKDVKSVKTTYAIANPFRQFQSVAGGNAAFCYLKGLTAPLFLVSFNDNNLCSRNT